MSRSVQVPGGHTEAFLRVKATSGAIRNEASANQSLEETKRKSRVRKTEGGGHEDKPAQPARLSR